MIFLKGTSSEEQGRIGASVDDLLGLLSAQLYQHPEVFLRELVSNAYDAMLRRSEAEPASTFPMRILVRGDGVKTVVVEDPGIGMDRSALVGFLACIGHSGTREARLVCHKPIGRFGLGFLSVLAVAQRVEVSTRPAAPGTEMAHAWSWQGGASYLLKEADRAMPGTRIQVELKPEFAHFAAPNWLADNVHRHARFLDVEFDVPPHGDPRPGSPPWLQLRRPDGELPRPGPALVGCVNPPHSFTAPLADGGGMALAFPLESLREPGGITLYQQGILVTERTRELLPEDWDWVRGVVNSRSANLTLGREAAQSDESFKQLRLELTTELERQLARFARQSREGFRQLVSAHRARMAHLLQAPGVLAALGEHYPFETTLGLLSFEEVLAIPSLSRTPLVRAEGAPGRQTFYFLTGYPATDSRWAAARTARELVFWCQTPEEEHLLGMLVARQPLAELRQLTWGERLSTRELLLSEEVRGLRDAISDQLKEHRVLVDSAVFSPEGMVSVVELPDSGRPWLPSTEAQGTGGGDLVASTEAIFAYEREAPEQARGRLFLNASNPVVRQLAKQEPSERAALAAALLFASGSVRSGLPMPIEWQPVLDSLTARGLAQLSRLPTTGSSEPHVVCFFAHEFKSHKPVLASLRTVLEYHPFYWEVRSADELIMEPQLYDNVMSHVRASDVVVGEISGRNPNVLLEVGLALGAGREVVLMARTEPQDVFSDLRGYLMFPYDPGKVGTPAFASYLRSKFKENVRLRNLQRARPFLGFRLLEDSKLLSAEECKRLTDECGTPDAFLAARAQEISRATQIPLERVGRAQRFLDERIKQHRASTATLP